MGNYPRNPNQSSTKFAKGDRHINVVKTLYRILQCEFSNKSTFAQINLVRWKHDVWCAAESKEAP